jgi:hypothetical protein
VPEKTYDEKAEEALLLAAVASDPAIAHSYSQMASAYRALARLQQRNMEPLGIGNSPR